MTRIHSWVSDQFGGFSFSSVRPLEFFLPSLSQFSFLSLEFFRPSLEEGLSYIVNQRVEGKGGTRVT